MEKYFRKIKRERLFIFLSYYVGVYVMCKNFKYSVDHKKRSTMFQSDIRLCWKSHILVQLTIFTFFILILNIRRQKVCERRKVFFYQFKTIYGQISFPLFVPLASYGKACKSNYFLFLTRKG